MTPTTNLRRRHQSVLLVVQWIFVLVQGATYYRREYSGYLFTIPGFDDTQRRTQSDAQNWCRQNGTSLLDISNASVQNAVVQFIIDVFNIQLTGNNIITSGKQSFTSSCYWVNGYVFQQGFQIVGQGGGSQYSYSYLDTNLSEYSAVVDLPTTQRCYICEGTESDCMNGYQTNGRCYKSFNDRLSWYESRNRCIDRGGDLASFDWMTTNQNLNVLHGSWLSSSSSYWIGLRRLNWNWQSSDTDVKYSQWSDGHPVYDQNQRCLCLLPNIEVHDWKWGECSCIQPFQFICIAAASLTSMSSSEPSSSTTTHSTARSISSASKQTSISTSHLFSTILTPPSSNDSTCTANRNIGLAVGLGVGIPALLIIASLITVIILQRQKLSRMMTKEPGPLNSTVEMTDQSNSRPYEPLNIFAPSESMRTYEQLKKPNETIVYDHVAN